MWKILRTYQINGPLTILSVVRKAQKQSSRSVSLKSFSKKFYQIYRKTSVIKSVFCKITLNLRIDNFSLGLHPEATARMCSTKKAIFKSVLKFAIRKRLQSIASVFWHQYFNYRWIGNVKGTLMQIWKSQYTFVFK